MKLQLFKNKKGMIHGSDSKRLTSDVGGVLKISSTEITLTPGEVSILPPLFHGATGNYTATFTNELGEEFTIDKIAVRGGWIVSPSPTAVELMELRCRADAAEDERAALWEKIHELENIFDTDSLNFLIK